MHDLDEWMQSQLLVAALKITTSILELGGTFVAKIFLGDNADLLKEQMVVFFKHVHIVKPPSSRASSMEHFLLCQELALPIGFQPQLFDIYLHGKNPECFRSILTDFPHLCTVLPFCALGSHEPILLNKFN